jgi:hypothetical protein
MVAKATHHLFEWWKKCGGELREAPEEVRIS